MCKNRYSAIISLAFAVSGCVTPRTEKPILTLSATNRIASECGAVRGVFHPSKPLPYVTFLFSYKKSGQGYEELLDCAGKKVALYRYSELQFQPEDGIWKDEVAP